MYDDLSMHGACHDIEYQGVLVGDVSLRENGELAIVICREYQNRHIGRRCIAEMRKLAREQGMDRVTANIYSFNMDQTWAFKTSLLAALMVKVTYSFIHTGAYKSRLLQKKFQKQMADPNPYNRAFVAMTGDAAVTYAIERASAETPPFRHGKAVFLTSVIGFLRSKAF